MLKTCSCGRTFNAETSRHRLCPICKAKHKKEHNKYTAQYRKECRHSILVDSNDFEVIKTVAEALNISIREAVHKIIIRGVLTDTK